MASSALPSFRIGMPFVPASAWKLAMISLLPAVFATEVSHSTTSASRPSFAAQKLSASTATPVGICTTSITPCTAFDCVASNDFTVAPNSGAWATSAVSMPGSFTSCVKIAVPLPFATPSTRGVPFDLPM